MLNLKEISLDWALKNINRFNDTYVFPRPFEFDAINEHWEEVKKYLMGLDVLSSGIRPYRTAITPKGELGFRISTQLDPLDSIITNAVLYEIHSVVEKARLPKDLKIVYSFRLDPQKDGVLYDNHYVWDTFQEEGERLAQTLQYKYVVLTDIADFYPSIYLHDIQTVLRECVRNSGQSAHAETLINMIDAMHLKQTHKGIPVGPQFSRPIAELVLDNLDRVLIDNKFVFIRYVDDYRIFCKTQTEAYGKLAFVAQKLFDILGLKLNEQKTKIVPIELFEGKYLKAPKAKEQENILMNFNELLAELGIEANSYEEIDIDALDEVDLERLKSINLETLLVEELKRDRIDYSFINFLLSSLARIDNTSVADIVLSEENIVKLSPSLRSVIHYLERIRSFSIEQKHYIGKKVLDLLKANFVCQLEFNRIWLLSLFTKGREWDNEDVIMQFINDYGDDATLRKLYLALGRSNDVRFFRTQKQKNLNIDPWVKRAFIAAISCLPESERSPWYKSRKLTSRDLLENIVEKWAEKNHF